MTKQMQQAIRTPYRVLVGQPSVDAMRQGMPSAEAPKRNPIANLGKHAHHPKGSPSYTTLMKGRAKP